ncbi:hypothetical protein C1H46_011407 [Malus baccata]|uniref:glucose-6-phosphate 1-epimerase n=1 Tax=Malus baccata TaxID=106549 RepID=A0A540MXQ6_MALBA|nr:hypothetical protein C1H46_011407 [Malus baccata]
MSSKATWKLPKAIRGGIPVCFPQFGNLGSLEQHGFAKNRLWSVDSDPSPLAPTNNQTSVDLILKSTEEDLKTWPRSFELRLRVSLNAGKLTLIPRVRNTDSKAFSFTFALINYLYVSDISEVRVEGLETLDYLDNLMRRESHDRPREEENLCSAEGWHAGCRLFNLDYFFVWNPWDKKAKTIPDLGDEDYKTMLCVDSAAIETPIFLKPSEEWKSGQELSTVSSSYCSGQLDPRMVLHGLY